MGKISVVINTLNEEENLPRALSSVKDWAFEVIVVDMESTDDTLKIAKKADAKVFTHKKTGYVEPARNFAIAKTKGDWVLVLDADEEIPSTLAKKLQQIVQNPEGDYYALARKNIVFGRWLKHSRWWPDYNLRFFKKGNVVWGNEIHSIPITKGRGLDLEQSEEFAIVHHHYENVEQYIDRLNRYTTVQAKEQKSKGKKPDWKNFISKPVSEFLSRYFAGEGYRDGVHGLAMASLQAFSELVVAIKLWQLHKFPEREIDVSEVSRELKSAQKEINYWMADSMVKQNGGISNLVKRKFRLP